MSPILEPKLRFGDVVYAIDTTPKVLRNWLQRDQVTLFTEDTGGWRNFSYADIAVLAVVRKLVDFGCGVETASHLAVRAFEDRSALTFSYKNTPPEALIASWLTHWLIVFQEHGDWQFINHPPAVRPLDLEDVDAYLTVQVADVLKRAFARATESNADGAID